MNWETAKKIPWGIIILFGGGFALAEAFTKSGLSNWFGQELVGLSHVNPIVLTFARITSYNVCYTKLLRYFGSIIFQFFC